MKRNRIVLAGFVACLLVSCTPASEKVGSSEDTAGVNKVRDEFLASFNAGDAGKVASLYAPDAVVMPSHQPIITGRDGVENYNKTFFEMYTAKITISPLETKVFGDRALDRGTYTIELTPKAGGNPIKDEGKYLILLQRQADGSWKVTHDIDNSNLPLTPPAAAAPAEPSKTGKTGK